MLVVKLIAHGTECAECSSVRKFLSDHTIPYDESDVNTDPNALQELVDRTGSATHVPVVIVGEETFIDFNEDIATSILELIQDHDKN
ncbi:MAG: glutaredoxin family protein [Candidatus Bathyarchaeia archaeon]